jgi:CRP/FNR family transcriptional regulator, nitrogen oxide reductase regulator
MPKQLSQPLKLFRGRPLGVKHTDVLPFEVVHGRNATVLEKSRLFSGVLPQDCKEICVGARVKEYARGEILFMDSDVVRQVFVVKSGFVKISQLGMSGMEAILRLCGPGDMVDAVSLFSVGRHCTTAQAIRKCQVHSWEAAAFKALVERCPLLQKNMAQVLGGYAMELEQRFREVATERVPQRLARQLLRMAETMGRPVDGAIEVGLSRQELAEMTGTTLFTVSRLLSGWEEQGIVIPRRGAVVILNLESLRATPE